MILNLYQRLEFTSGRCQNLKSDKNCVLTYDEYVSMKKDDEPVMLDYGGMVSDIHGIYNIYKTLNRDGEDGFDFDLVKETTPVYAGVDVWIVIGLVVYNYSLTGTELSHSDMMELKRVLDAWNRKHGSVQYICTERTIDVREKFKELDEYDGEDEVYQV